MVPNIHMKIRIKFKSPVPVLAEICPKDTIELFKCGNCIRINTTIAGVNTNGIPKVIKGKQSFLAIIDSENGTVKTYLIDCIRKIYQEFYPIFPDWCIENIIKSNVDVSSFFKFMIDLSSLSIKQKKGSLLKKGKKTLHLERNKAYKADVFKIKGVKTESSKRFKESVIGPYKSDIKTSVIKVDGSKKKGSNEDGMDSIFQKFGDDIMKANNGKPMKTYVDRDDDDDDDSDSDSDISDSEQTSELSQRKSKEKMTVTSSVFQKYIKHTDPNYFDPETDKHISEMIVRGYDDDNVTITNNDIQFLRENYPKYLKNILINNLENNNFGNLERLQAGEFKGKFEGKVSKDGKTIVYEVTNDDSENTLNWDEMYDLKHPKGEEEDKLKTQGQKKMNSDRMKDFDFEKNKITEGTYFNPAQTENLHVGRIFDVSQEKKSFENSIKIWMSRDNEFPITLDHIKPILNYAYSLLEYDENKIKSFQSIFKSLHSDKRYPIKVETAILPVLKCQLKTIECNLDPSVIPEGIFNIPSDYKPGNVLVESRKKNKQ